MLGAHVNRIGSREGVQTGGANWRRCTGSRSTLAESTGCATGYQLQVATVHPSRLVRQLRFDLAFLVYSWGLLQVQRQSAPPTVVVMAWATPSPVFCSR